jgi:hypothetical protein
MTDTAHKWVFMSPFLKHDERRGLWLCEVCGVSGAPPLIDVLQYGQPCPGPSLGPPATPHTR